MENDKVLWCFGIKNGLKIMEPNERLAESYLKESKASLARAEKNLRDGDLLWATVVLYYAEYYALYAFLQKIGVKCENHFCSIITVTALLGEEKTKTINLHKDKRIDAQYYMKVDKEEQVQQMLREGKIHIATFDELLSQINERETERHRTTLKKIKKQPRRKKK